MTSFRSDYGGIGDMLTSDFMKADMLARAERIKATAEATSPKETGEYASSFHASVKIQHHETARAAGVVTNTSEHAFYVEYGGKGTPKYHTLLNAAMAAGA